MKKEFKKLTAVFMSKHQAKVLANLRELGVFHLDISVEPIHSEIDLITRQINQLEGVERLLAPGLEPSNIQKMDLEQLLNEVAIIEAEIDKLEQKIDTDYKNLEKIQPWGAYDHNGFKRLIEHGYHVFFCQAANELMQYLDLSDQHHYFVKKTRYNSYFVIISKAEKLKVHFDYFEMPERSPEDLKAAIESSKKELIQARHKLEGYFPYFEQIKVAIQEKRDELELVRTLHSLERSGEDKLALLNAWYPLDQEEQVTDYLNKLGITYQTKNAASEEDPPVALKNNAYVKLFEPITKIFELPNYYESDLTPFIAVFYPILFAYCLGDAGYGFVLTVIMVYGYFTFFQNNRSAAVLGIFLGLTTTFMGLVKSGSFFGIPTLENADSSFLNYMGQFVLIPDDSDFLFNAFNVALMIGVLQIITGIIISIYNKIVFDRSLQALSAVGKLFIVVSLLWVFLVDMQANQALDFGGPLRYVTLTIGVVLVAGFHVVDVPVHQRVAGAFMPLFFIFTGILGDILSFVRLFALGLASSVLGLVVNQIGAQIMSGSVLAFIIGIAFLLFGHTLNFGIAALGSFVHPLRLTFVEFYGNANFLGKGIPYRPFKKSIDQVIKS